MTDGANLCTLEVGGQIYGGWERLEIQRSLEQIAGGFALQVTTRWPGSDAVIGLPAGLACVVKLGSDVVITGFIDTVEPDCTATTSTLRLEGRDKTGDLVDCSAIFKTGQWRGVKLEQIVADIAAPFGIKVVVATDTGEVFKRYALEEGEKAFDAIDRACRLRAVLVTSTPDGHLLLTTASSTSTGVLLAEGVNMLRFGATHSWRERHSIINMKTQVPGDDDESGASAAHLKAAAADAEINRYRPLTVVAEHGTSAEALAGRAAWEAKVRMGRGKRGRCTVVGWRTGKDGQEGPLWLPNTLVQVRSERMGLDMELLIVSCSYQLTEEGQLCELVFVRPEAFTLIDGAARSRLKGKLNDKIQSEKNKKAGGFVPLWELSPPNPRDPRGSAPK
ncbi:MAG: phage baseplate assembly protein [Polaromonas sp.]